MKLLFYCTKAKPYLVKASDFNGAETKYKCIFQKGTDNPILNGYIVAEAEIDRVYRLKIKKNDVPYLNDQYVNTLYYEFTFLKKACLTNEQLIDYLKNEKGDHTGYAIYLKNVKPFYEPRKLNYYGLKKPPQNMCYVRYPVPYDNKLDGWEVSKDSVVISIQPEWLCIILNGEKTIEVRRKVLKDMKGD